MNHQEDNKKTSEGRSSVAAAWSISEKRPEPVHFAAQALKTDAELSLRVANAETCISALEYLEQKVSER